MPNNRRVALILDISSPYDRKVVAGISRYVWTVGNWSIYVEEDPVGGQGHPQRWRGDGVIANFDDQRLVDKLLQLQVPLVGVGGGYGGYRPGLGVHYVATDNREIAEMAFAHLWERGLRRFAYCGLPATATNRWSLERSRAFAACAGLHGTRCSLFARRHSVSESWGASLNALARWLISLEKPVGLLAADDARARHVLEACRYAGVRVPEEVAVIGVDDDELACELMIPPLSSVIQGTDRLGFEAAALLDRLMNHEILEDRHFVIGPVGITTRQSTDIMATTDDQVRRAVTFIRAHIGTGVRMRDVVQQAGCSRATLDVRFVRALGRTVHEEIHHIRLELARDLLRRGNLPLKQVASRAGYSTVQYMTDVFRRHLGKTPGQIRRLVDESPTRSA